MRCRVSRKQNTLRHEQTCSALTRQLIDCGEHVVKTGAITYVGWLGGDIVGLRVVDAEYTITQFEDETMLQLDE